MRKAEISRDEAATLDRRCGTFTGLFRQRQAQSRSPAQWICLIKRGLRMSRLRRPISKSITQVFRPLLASPNAKDAADVVFPTPPFPEVMHTMRPLPSTSPPSTSEGWDSCEKDLIETYLRAPPKATNREVGRTKMFIVAASPLSPLSPTLERR